MSRSGKTSPVATPPPSHRSGRPLARAPPVPSRPGCRATGSWRRPGWLIFHAGRDPAGHRHAQPVGVAVPPAARAPQLQRRASAPAPRRRRSPSTPSCPPGTTVDGARPEEWKTVIVTGTFDPATQVLIRNRSLDGAPGYHVLTPLKRRRWHRRARRAGLGAAVHLEQRDARRATAGRRHGHGRGPRPAHPEPGRAGATAIRPTGVLATMARIDIPRVQQQTPYPVEPAYVEMTSSSPAPTTALPTLVPLPELDDGPHLGYAVQWIIFSICAVIGWFLLVRKSAKGRDQQRAAAAAKEAVRRLARRWSRVSPQEWARGRPARRRRRCRRCSAARRSRWAPRTLIVGEELLGLLADAAADDERGRATAARRRAGGTSAAACRTPSTTASRRRARRPDARRSASLPSISM